ncbi:MAG: hypothetical protein ABEK29_08280, partial [Bradymonadaceae bacterium]
ALYAANSFFTDGYLTTGGQGESKDYRMITQAGFEPVVVGDRDEAPEPEVIDEETAAGGGCCGAKETAAGR